MSLRLPKGEIVGVPQTAGDLVLYQDTDGVVKTVSSAGVKGAIGGWTDPFSVMSARAAAYAAQINNPFNSYLQEDFAYGGLTVTSTTGGTGAVTFSTNATNYGSGGIVKCASGATAGVFAFVTPINFNAWATDFVNTSYYVEALATLNGALSEAASTKGIGVMKAVTPTSTTPFVIFGAIQSASATNWGLTFWNGTTQTYAAGSTAIDIGHQHYFALGHDATAHLFTGYVDGVAVVSASDSAMVGIGATMAFTVFDQATAGPGSTNCDKIFAAV